jgi:Holliday junction resolvasome RuvABC ATP-dependent DNA helicase subunit
MHHPAFSHVVGQTNAKSLLSLSINSSKMDGELIQPLFLGEAGLGKTEMARAYGNAIAQELGVNMIEYATPKDFRLITDFDPFLDRLISDDKFVVYIDECHEIDTKMVSHAKFIALLRKALDRQNDKKVIQIADRQTTFDRTKKVFILATNHSDKVDAAIKSRMDVINLTVYNMNEMKEITKRILEKNELECDCDQTLTRISTCGRGTARPIVNLVQNVFKLMGLSVIDNDAAMTALRMKEMFPAGLKADEVRLLDICKDSAFNRMQICSALTGLIGVFSESAAYLIQKGLLEAVKGGYKTTPKGQKYLRFAEREGFVW